MKKKIALLLATAMTVSALAGCGNTGAGAQTGNAGTDAQTTTAAADGDVVTLKWVTIGSGMPDNYDSWVKQVISAG